MTDRVNAFVVVLEDDFRDDDAERISQAIRALRGVVSVQPHLADISDLVASQRIRHEIWEKIHVVIFGA